MEKNLETLERPHMLLVGINRVEEEELFNKLMISCLCKVTRFETEVQALNEIFQHGLKVNIIALEINILRMAGYNVIEKIKKTPLTMDVPVIVVSCEYDTPSYNRYMNDGAAMFLSVQKPRNFRGKQIVEIPKQSHELTVNDLIEVELGEKCSEWSHEAKMSGQVSLDSEVYRKVETKIKELLAKLESSILNVAGSFVAFQTVIYSSTMSNTRCHIVWFAFLMSSFGSALIMTALRHLTNKHKRWSNQLADLQTDRQPKKRMRSYRHNITMFVLFIFAAINSIATVIVPCLHSKKC